MVKKKGRSYARNKNLYITEDFDEEYYQDFKKIINVDPNVTSQDDKGRGRESIGIREAIKIYVKINKPLLMRKPEENQNG